MSLTAACVLQLPQILLATVVVLIVATEYCNLHTFAVIIDSSAGCLPSPFVGYTKSNALEFL